VAAGGVNRRFLSEFFRSSGRQPLPALEGRQWGLSEINGQASFIADCWFVCPVHAEIAELSKRSDQWYRVSVECIGRQWLGRIDG